MKGLKEKETERENCFVIQILHEFYIYLTVLFSIGKRAQQKKAEDDFIKLLRETKEIKYDSSWRKV